MKIVSIISVFSPVINDFVIIGVGNDNFVYLWNGENNWVKLPDARKVQKP